MKCSILNVDIDVVTFDMIENVTNAIISTHLFGSSNCAFIFYYQNFSRIQ